MENFKKYPIIIHEKRNFRIKLTIDGDDCKDPNSLGDMIHKENSIITNNYLLTPEKYTEVLKKLNKIYVILKNG